MKKVAIGVDIGGGSVKLALVDTTGKIFDRKVFLTKKMKGRKALLKELEVQVLELLTRAKKRAWKCVGVGIGAPGPIDVERGFVYFFPNIPGWKNTPLKKILEKRLRIPVAVDNDANVMALAEFRFGAGRGCRNMIGLTLGTGVGGGIVLNGKLFHGPAYSAAEIGHVVLNEKGPICGCGNRGCIETYVGSGYFVKRALEYLRSGEKSIVTRQMKKGEALTPYMMQEAAKKGDAFSQKVWRETGEHLGNALVGFVNVLNPERIIIGGGLAESRELLFGPLIAILKKKAFPIAAASVRVMPAALGVDAGIVGAAALVMD